MYFSFVKMYVLYARNENTRSLTNHERIYMYTRTCITRLSLGVARFSCLDGGRGLMREKIQLELAGSYW